MKGNIQKKYSLGNILAVLQWNITYRSKPYNSEKSKKPHLYYLKTPLKMG